MTHQLNIFRVKQYNDLSPELKDKVAEWLKHQIYSHYEAIASVKQYKEALKHCNSEVVFYKIGVQKLFQVRDDVHESLSKLMAESLFNLKVVPHLTKKNNSIHN